MTFNYKSKIYIYINYRHKNVKYTTSNNNNKLLPFLSTIQVIKKMLVFFYKIEIKKLVQNNKIKYFTRKYRLKYLQHVTVLQLTYILTNNNVIMAGIYLYVQF